MAKRRGTSEGRAQGQSDTPLNARGRAQAEITATRLAPLEFEAAYSSDLQRVSQTAEAILRERGMPFTEMVSLREKAFGEWEGLTFEEVERNHPSMFRRLFDEDVDFAPPGGESDNDLYARMQSAAEELLAKHADSDGNILDRGTRRVSARAYSVPHGHARRVHVAAAPLKLQRFCDQHFPR